MDCQGCQDLLVDFLYGELDPDARRAFQAHLDGCAACAREAEQLGQVLSLVRAHPEEAPADALSQRILHAAQVATDHRSHQAAVSAPWWRWLLSPAPMTAVLAMVVASVGLAVYLSKPPPGQAPAAPRAAAEVAPAATPVAPAKPTWDAAAMDEEKGASEKDASADGAKREVGLENSVSKPKAVPTTRPADAPAVGTAGVLDGVRGAPAAEPAPDQVQQRARKQRRAKKSEKAKRRVLGGALMNQADKKADRMDGLDDLAKDQDAAKLAGSRGSGGRAGSEGAVGGVMRRPAGPGPNAAQLADRSTAVRPRPKPAKAAPAPARFAVPPPPPSPELDMATGRKYKAEEREAQTEKKLPPPAPTVARAAPAARTPAESIALQGDADAAEFSAGEDDEAPVMAEAARPGAAGKASAQRSPRPSVDLYAQAERALTRKEYAVAALGFRTFLSERPGDARVPTARYRLARALFLAGRCVQAIQATQRAVRTAPRHRLAADALFDQASCHVRQGQFAAAQRIYRRIERDHPGRASEASREAERIAPVDAAPARAAPASDR